MANSDRYKHDQDLVFQRLEEMKLLEQQAKDAMVERGLKDWTDKDTRQFAGYLGKTEEETREWLVGILKKAADEI